MPNEDMERMESIQPLFREAIGKLEKQLRDCEDSELLLVGFLEGAAEFYGAERAYVIEVDWDMNIGLTTYEWCRSGVASHKDDMQYLPMEIFPRWRFSLLNNKPIVISDISELLITHPEEYSFFKNLQINSLIATPFSKRINHGYIGVDNPTRFQTDPTFLFVLSYVVVLELNEIKLQNSVDAAERMASQHIADGIYIKGFDGLEIIGPKGTLTEDDIKSDQSYSLLCYLLLTRHQQHTVERLYEILRPEDEVMDSNPYAVVKNVVYRTRKNLSVIGIENLIIAKSGSFCINPDINLHTDFERFEASCSRLDIAKEPALVDNLYKTCLELYKGTLFPRVRDHKIIMPLLVYYQSLYLNIIKRYIERLLDNGEYSAAQKVVRDGQIAEPDDNDLHYLMIRVLHLQGNNSIAQSYLLTKKNALTKEQITTAEQMLNRT